MDKYKALWVSHSSLADFLKCPRAYYLRNVYKDPKTGHKITVTSPALSLGQAVHDVLEKLSFMAVGERFKQPLSCLLDEVWSNVSGEKGGFLDQEKETEFRQRAERMLSSVEKNPGPLLNKAVKIKAEGGLPYFWLSETENIILCGKVDWMEYLPETDSLHIIDFKTGKGADTQDSWQLPIYYLLAKNTQSRPVTKMSYWFLEGDLSLVEKHLPDETSALEEILEVARRIKLGRQIVHFKCPTEGCFACRPLERVLSGEGKLVGLSNYRQDIYVLEDKTNYKKNSTASPTDIPF